METQIETFENRESIQSKTVVNNFELGPVFQIGIDFKINQKFAINLDFKNKWGWFNIIDGKEAFSISSAFLTSGITYKMK